MNLAEIKNGIVTNIIVVDPTNIPAWCASWPEAIDGFNIGARYVNGVIIPLPVAPPTAEEIRASRNYILASAVDPLVSNPLRWADLTAEKQTEWAAYRRALLDLPQQEGFPIDITWPTQPE